MRASRPRGHRTAGFLPTKPPDTCPLIRGHRTRATPGCRALSSGPGDNIPMTYLSLKARLHQVLADLVGHHHGPMLSAGAAEGDGQVALTLTDVMGQQIDQEVGNTLNEFSGLRKGADVAGHPRIAPREVLEPRNVIRVRQKANVENQVAVRRNSLPVTETGHVDQDWIRRSGRGTARHELPQFVNRKLGSVDDQVRHRPYGGKLARSERMLLGIDRPIPSGWGRRVSLKRWTMASSSASRKSACPLNS